jgi:hypothetical protein
LGVERGAKTPPRKKFFVTKLSIKTGDNGREYVRRPRFFKNCRATEEEGCRVQGK